MVLNGSKLSKQKTLDKIEKIKLNLSKIKFTEIEKKNELNYNYELNFELPICLKCSIHRSQPISNKLISYSRNRILLLYRSNRNTAPAI